MQSFGNELVLFAGNWLGIVECWQFVLLVPVGCVYLVLAIVLSRNYRFSKKKKNYSYIFTNTTIEKPNIGGF